MNVRLLVVLCAIILSGCSHGFREEDVTAAKTSIRSEFQKQGFSVEEVVLLRESDTKLSGYVKLRKSFYDDGGVLRPMPQDIALTRSCTATMAADSSQYFWECR